MRWFIDFDDTLAVGPMTWAFENVIPRMVREHNLLYDPIIFDEAALTAQRHANENIDENIVLDDLFKKIDWPQELKDQFIHNIYTGYVPSLFDDALPFLDRLTAAAQDIFILSNNNHAAYLAKQLGIAHYFTAILTPQSCGGLPAKPQRDMWDYAVVQHAIEVAAPAVIVGDDPWSDGDFSQNCNISCWILDRMNRYGSLHESKPYKWVHSLSEITY
jgi:FMN phosphatase YigB (HAD superfamily)